MPTTFSHVSALALAGANNRRQILLAEEVAAMRLTGVEWAVLSACDTGIGALVRERNFWTLLAS